MLPAEFPQSNALLGPPAASTAAQPLKVFMGEINGGALKGTKVVVTAWRPTTEELLRLNAGGALYVSCLGGMHPHFVTADFNESTNPR